MAGIDVQFNIISYAVVSSKYEDNKNITASFMPLVEHLLSTFDNDYVEEKEIASAYQKLYGYPMHAAILNELLKVLKKQNKIERLRAEHIQINKDNLQSYGKQAEYETELRALVSDFDLFLQKRGKQIKRSEIPNYVLNFIRKNALDFNSFIQYQSNLDDVFDDGEIREDLIAFFLEERRNNTKNYSFIQSIYGGIILSAIMVAGDDSTMSICEDFSIEHVLLDSNYIFRLLDLQTTLEHQAALDTFDALKKMKCTLWVCHETLKQIADTIHNVIDQYSTSASAVLRVYGDERFTGLASACIRRDLTPAKLEDIVGKLKNTLEQQFSVQIIDSEEYNADCIKRTSDDFKSLATVKRDSSDFGIIHDLFLIHVIRSKRSKTMYTAEQAKWWVLTDDNKLTKWNSQNLSSSSVSECITESQLATIIWVCNPKNVANDAFLNSVIALRNQGLASNKEFLKITQNIAAQIKKYSEDPTSLEKLSLVFSQRMLKIDDLLSDDAEAVDSLITQKILEADQLVASQKKLTEDAHTALNKEKAENLRLAGEIHAAKSLLSAESEQLIATWKQIRDEKRIEAIALEKKIESSAKKHNCQLIIFRVIWGLLLACAFFSILPLVDEHLGNFYNKHQLVCGIGWFIVSAFFSYILGLDKHKLGKIFKMFCQFSVHFFVKIKVLRDFEFETLELTTRRNNLLASVKNLQDKIDEKLKTVESAD